jgi:hypothetical protein
VNQAESFKGAGERHASLAAHGRVGSLAPQGQDLSRKSHQSMEEVG